MNPAIIAITGTKGKTTATHVVSEILRALGKNVLKVDTTGHYINGEQKSTLDDSRKTWRLVPSVCPGRYLWEFHANPGLQENGVAVLECSLGCSGGAGTGYRHHQVGVFLNVFEDHLGSSDRLQSKEDIALAKKFIFTRLDKDGSYAVFNADDRLVCKTLVEAVPENCELLPCGLNFDAFDLEAHLSIGGKAFTVKDGCVVLLDGEGEKQLVDLKAIPWTFNATYMPSVVNILHAVAAVYANLSGELPTNFKEIVESVKLDSYGGRLTLLKNSDNVTILADYAHEKKSITEIGQLASTMTDGKVIGVVRLAQDRTDSLIAETGKVIAETFDTVVVYDKIDGHFRKARDLKNRRFPEVEGRVSQVLADAVAETNKNVYREVREDHAAAKAAELAQPGDVVVYIVNDDIKRSIGFIKDAFKAEFI